MINKDVKYLNKDFNTLKSKLIDFSKSYYPETYNDFSENSPGMIFIDMASYVGDILSLYQDNQILENFPQFSRIKKNLLNHSYVYGYTPKVTTVSNTIIDIFQIVPSINISGSLIPDFNYSLIIDENTQIKSSENSNINFIIEDKIDFSISSSNDITDISIYSLNNNQPEYYLLKKQRKAYSGIIKTKEFTFNNPEKFKTVTISDDKIIKIINVTDSDDNQWYEVPYLTQETIFNKIKVSQVNNFNTSSYSTPYLLKLEKVPNRFITRFKNSTTLQIQFGSGILEDSDEEIIPNTENIGLGLPYGINKMNTAFDPSNFMYTKSYGLSPSNTTLTFTYLVGGGVESNIPANTLNILTSGSITFNGDVENSTSNTVLNSLSFNNDKPSIGGGDGDSIEDLRNRIISSHPTQKRAITKDDYIIRSLSLPSEFGLVSKSYITKDTYNQNVLSLYILSKNNNNNLDLADIILKNNLKTYLNEFISENDSVYIKNAYIINIGVNFDITIRPNYNNKLVINSCLKSIKDYFDIDKWNINQPIILSEIYNLLDAIEGVQTVKKVIINNKYGENINYSKYGYDIKGATIGGVIYPSQDPSIFEIKFPDKDIQGRVVNF